MHEQNHTNPPVWERCPEEKALWYGRFCVFLHMGTERTLLGAVHRVEEAEKGRKKQSKKVPGSWNTACDQWQWHQRAEAWDAAERARIEAQRQVYVDAIMQEGYALVHERVKSLGDVARQLLGYIGEVNRVFLPDVKSIGFGESTERVDLVNFNDALFEQYRKYVADIAAETGGRVKQVKQDSTVAIDVTSAQESLFNKVAAFAKKTADEQAES